VTARTRWTRGALVAATLAAVAALVAASPSPRSPGGPRATPSPTPLPDYNQRLGSNRQAADAAAAAGRLLFANAGYWEVFVRTDPLALPKVDPSRPALAASPVPGVAKVLLVMATESGASLTQFRGTGHDHERAAMTPLLRELAARFPGAPVECDVYFGESHLHARATLSGGAIQYTVLDTL